VDAAQISQIGLAGETGIGPAFVYRIGSYCQGRSLSGSSCGPRLNVRLTLADVKGGFSSGVVILSYQPN